METVTHLSERHIRSCFFRYLCTYSHSFCNFCKNRLLLLLILRETARLISSFRISLCFFLSLTVLLVSKNFSILNIGQLSKPTMKTVFSNILTHYFNQFFCLLWQYKPKNIFTCVHSLAKRKEKFTMEME